MPCHLLASFSVLCILASAAESPPASAGVSSGTGFAAVGTDAVIQSRQRRAPSASTARLQKASRKAAQKQLPAALSIDTLGRLADALSAERLHEEAAEARRELLGILQLTGNAGGPIASGALRHSVALASDLKALRRYDDALAVVRGAAEEIDAAGGAEPAASVLLLKVSPRRVGEPIDRLNGSAPLARRRWSRRCWTARGTRRRHWRG